MNTRFFLTIVLLGIAAGAVTGIVAGASLFHPAATVRVEGIQLGTPEQDDFIIMVAEAYAGDRDLRLAQDRLTRLSDKHIATRVEKLALIYAPQRDIIALHLAGLAVALGARSPALFALNATPVPTAAAGPAAGAGTDGAAPAAWPATAEPSLTAAPLPTLTPPASAGPAQAAVAVARVLAPSPTSPPPTSRLPTARPPTAPPPTARPPTAVPPPPPAPALAPALEPDPGRWPGTVHYIPANVAPGQSYWRLTKAIYCDAFDKSDPRQHDFGCDEMPGGSAGTNIYVMTGGAAIDVIRPDGVNVGDDPGVIGDKKSPNDMCNCTYSFESSAYRISVRGAPSDAIEGFCLCSVNFGWGSRAHVRYFLYFEYVTR